MRRGKFILMVVVMGAVASVSAAQDRKALAKPTPRYPEIAKRMQLVGIVKIEVVIGTDGKIKEKETKVIGGHPVLVQAALDALKDWKYEPSKVETEVTLTFDFRP